MNRNNKAAGSNSRSFANKGAKQKTSTRKSLNSKRKPVVPKGNISAWAKPKLTPADRLQQQGGIIPPALNKNCLDSTLVKMLDRTHGAAIENSVKNQLHKINNLDKPCSSVSTKDEMLKIHKKQNQRVFSNALMEFTESDRLNGLIRKDYNSEISRKRGSDVAGLPSYHNNIKRPPQHYSQQNQQMYPSHNSSSCFNGFCNGLPYSSNADTFPDNQENDKENLDHNISNHLYEETRFADCKLSNLNRYYDGLPYSPDVETQTQENNTQHSNFLHEETRFEDWSLSLMQAECQKPLPTNDAVSPWLSDSPGAHLQTSNGFTPNETCLTTSPQLEPEAETVSKSEAQILPPLSQEAVIENYFKYKDPKEDDKGNGTGMVDLVRSMLHARGRLEFEKRFLESVFNDVLQRFPNIFKILTQVHENMSMHHANISG